jgi:hypothetical protein
MPTGMDTTDLIARDRAGDNKRVPRPAPGPLPRVAGALLSPRPRRRGALVPVTPSQPIPRLALRYPCPLWGSPLGRFAGVQGEYRAGAEKTAFGVGFDERLPPRGAGVGVDCASGRRIVKAEAKWMALVHLSQ